MSKTATEILVSAVEHITDAMYELGEYLKLYPDASKLIAPLIDGLDDISDVVDAVYGDEASGIGEPMEDAGVTA